MKFPGSYDGVHIDKFQKSMRLLCVKFTFSKIDSYHILVCDIQSDSLCYFFLNFIFISRMRAGEYYNRLSGSWDTRVKIAQSPSLDTINLSKSAEAFNR